MIVASSRTDGPPRGRGRSRAANKAFRRQQIIAATIDSISRHGFAETTVATVAREAGVSQGILIFHFKTKEALLVETLAFLAEEYGEIWRKALDAAPPDPVARILAMVESDFHSRICTRKKVAVWHAFYGEAKSRPTYLEICGQRDAERSAILSDLCAEALAREPATPWDADSASQCIEQLTDGLWVHLLLSSGALRRRRALSVSLRQLLSIFPASAEQIRAALAKVSGGDA